MKSNHEGNKTRSGRPQGVQDRSEALNPKRQGRTKPQQDEMLSPVGVPRLPHERDESSDSQDSGTPRPLMRKAHDDVTQGRVDTDKGTPMNDTYQRQKEAPKKQPT